MKNVLVTGGAGFIGSNLVDKLILQKYNVTIIDNLSTGKKKNINKKAVFYKCDIRDFDRLSKTFNLCIFWACAQIANNLSILAAQIKSFSDKPPIACVE